MGEAIFDEFPEYTQIADEILGYSIKELCLTNPNQLLNKTEFTQPALYIVNSLSYYQKNDWKQLVSLIFMQGQSWGV